MITFLPYPDIVKSAKCLDRARLGKQRVEAFQLLKGDWPNHPASKMWNNEKMSLFYYTCAICQEWRNRGYKDSVEAQALDYMLCIEKIPASLLIHGYTPTELILTDNKPIYLVNELFEKFKPFWWNDERVFKSHRANLLRKNLIHYAQFADEFKGIDVQKYPYFWPKKEMYVSQTTK